jgi:SNF2 family DNA or RNA helicase
MTVRVERAGNRILLASQTPTPGLARSLPGAYWRDREGVWSLPLDLTTCALLRDRFGPRLTIGPILTAWARAEKAKRETAAETAAAETADLVRLPEVAPTLFAGTASRLYQRSAIRFVADAVGRDGRRRALIADTVGLGKTVEAIGAILESGVPGPYLIVCPLGAVELTWAPEIRRWIGDDARIVTLPTGREKREEVLGSLIYGPEVYDGQAMADTEAALERYEPVLARTWVIVHPAIVRTQTWLVCALCGDKTKYKAGPVEVLDCGHERGGSKTEHDHTFPQLFDMEWGAIVADESDQILIRLTGTPNLQRRGMEMLRDLVVPDGVRIAMSGTPFRSKPHQIWSTLNWLDPVRWSGKWRWIQSYWKTGGYSGYEIIKDGFMEERTDMMLADLKDVMIRRTREEVRGDLPAKMYPSNAGPDMTPGIYLPMSAKQEKAYQQIVKTGSAQIEGGELNSLGVLAEMTRMKQFAGAVGRLNARREFEPLAEGNKYDWIIEHLRTMGFPDRPDSKIVIASQFTKLLNAFAAGVKAEFKSQVGIGFVTGEQGAKDRMETVATFEDPANRHVEVLFINTKAGGSSITLDAADSMVVLDETWVDDEQQQLEGRNDNRNPELKIVPRSYYYLRSLGTIEETIAEANAQARRTGQAVLDGAAIARRAKELTR